MNYVCDENINDTTYDSLIDKGEKIKHVKRDYGMGGYEDAAVMALAKKLKATLITANTRHFKSKTFVDDSIVRNSYGVVMFTSPIPEEQIKMYYGVKKNQSLNTSNKRRNKRIVVHKGAIVAIDVVDKSETRLIFRW